MLIETNDLNQELLTQSNIEKVSEIINRLLNFF